MLHQKSDRLWNTRLDEAVEYASKNLSDHDSNKTSVRGCPKYKTHDLGRPKQNKCQCVQIKSLVNERMA
jgi:hypothetical protein